MHFPLPFWLEFCGLWSRGACHCQVIGANLDLGHLVSAGVLSSLSLSLCWFFGFELWAACEPHKLTSCATLMLPQPQPIVDPLHQVTGNNICISVQHLAPTEPLPLVTISSFQGPSLGSSLRQVIQSVEHLTAYVCTRLVGAHFVVRAVDDAALAITTRPGPRPSSELEDCSDDDTDELDPVEVLQVLQQMPIHTNKLTVIETLELRDLLTRIHHRLSVARASRAARVVSDSDPTEYEAAAWTMTVAYAAAAARSLDAPDERLMDILRWSMNTPESAATEAPEAETPEGGWLDSWGCLCGTARPVHFWHLDLDLWLYHEKGLTGGCGCCWFISGLFQVVSDGWTVLMNMDDIPTNYCST